MASEAAPRRAVRNIAEIVALEQEEIRRRPPSSQPADAVARFAGTPLFVLLRALAIGGYVVVNAGMGPGVTAFDPFPYGLLGGFFSLEGVLVAAFVLMKQNSADARAGGGPAGHDDRQGRGSLCRPGCDAVLPHLRQRGRHASHRGAVARDAGRPGLHQPRGFRHGLRASPPPSRPSTPGSMTSCRTFSPTTC
jgi:hypothetical protein